jgi:hypothetical protein
MMPAEFKGNCMLGLSFESQLLSLNKWAQPYSKAWSHFPPTREFPVTIVEFEKARTIVEFEKARREAAQARLFKGIENWNTWATEMLAIKKRLKSDNSFLFIWNMLAKTNLENEKFSSSFDAGSAIFPGALNLSGASFEGDTWFNFAKINGPIKCTNTLFNRDVYFEGATFEETANFAEVHCRGRAEFRNLTFRAGVSFERANFVKDAWFRGSQFAGPTVFHRASFSGEAGLGSCSYGQNTDFSAAYFGDNAGFDNAQFGGSVNFDDAHFERNAWFSGAKFHGPATFGGATFRGKMHFAHIEMTLKDSSATQQLRELIALAGGDAGS